MTHYESITAEATQPLKLHIPMIQNPRIVLGRNERIERIRAGFGLVLLFFGLSALGSLAALLVTKVSLCGLLFGLFGIAFVLVAKKGKKYSRPNYGKGWRSIEVDS